MFLELPAVAVSTPADRLQALNDAKDLMSGPKPGGFAALFSDGPSGPGASAAAIDGFIRLAEYITTGHDYKDTHPEGKRRPIIRTTNVTVVAPPTVDDEDLEHLLSHVEDGSFGEFMRDVIKNQNQPETADAEKSADDEKAEDTKPFEL